MTSLPTFTALDERVAGDPAAAHNPDLTLHEPIGRGGMGVVVRATQRALDRTVAVKMLHPEAHSDAKASALLREALILGRLEHPNIVPVYTLGQLGPAQPALVMKRIDGVSWHELLYAPDHPLWSELDADDRLTFHITVLLQICRALEFAHGHGVIHRDIKPANVMIGAYGEVYLLDWGIALHLDERSDHDPPALLGTPAYMAPEMVRGLSAAIDARTDVYLLGATLHEVLTGQPRHSADSLLATLAAAERSDPAVFSALVPPELAAIVNRATAADPADRYPDLPTLRAALRAYLRHRDSRALSDQALDQARLLARALASADDARGAEADRDAQIPALFAAAAFGFRVALRGWPDNPDALRGLRDAARDLIKFELRRGDHEHAARLLAQHPEAADPELHAELERQQERARRAAQERDDLLRLRDDLDFQRNQRQRKRLFLSFNVPVLLVSLAIILAAPEDAALTWPQIFTGLAVILLAYLGLLWWFRAAIMKTLIDRRLSATLFVLLLLMFAQRLFAWSDGLTIPQALFNDLMLGALNGLLMGVLIERRMFIVAAPFLLGVLLARVMPDRVGLVFSLAGIGAVTAITFVFQSRPRATATTDPPR